MTSSGRSLYFDRLGRPLELFEWADLFEIHDYRMMATTWVNAKLRVSTIWLGVNHQWDPQQPPIIFETMTFGSGWALDDCCTRYSTEAEALLGHEIIVSYLSQPGRAHRAVKWARDETRCHAKRLTATARPRPAPPE